jgi:hypothetical protein
LRPAWAKSSQDPLSKIATIKWIGGVAQAVKCLLCNDEVLSSNSSPAKKIIYMIEKNLIITWKFELFISV